MGYVQDDIFLQQSRFQARTDQNRAWLSRQFLDSNYDIHLLLVFAFVALPPWHVEMWEGQEPGAPAAQTAAA